MRVFLFVLDSLGIGNAPDADAFGDTGANTLMHIAASPAFRIPNLTRMGLAAIDGVTLPKGGEKPTAAHARMVELSAGKDTTVGHFEIAGVRMHTPFPTYPDGFPSEILDEFRRQTGRGVLCNRPYSGTDVIRDYGDRHVASGDLIVYTSADSVFQIAAHESIVPPETLYRYCEIARAILVGKHGVSRVIARPFTGESGAYTRTERRRDFSLPPPDVTMLDILKSEGYDVIAVGKIRDIYAGRGVTQALPTHNNKEGMAAALSLTDTDFSGLAFINLVDFDMLYGHRNDREGYANALSEFDAFLPRFLEKMKKDDILIVTADHGCDPTDRSTDHTRECVPLLVYGDRVLPKNLGTRHGFDCVAGTVLSLLGTRARIVAAPDLTGEILRRDES